MPWLLRQLQNQARLSLRELVTVARTSPWYRDPARRGTFDAESWALMHLLLFGDETNQRATEVDQFIAALEKGTESPAAFEGAFGDPASFESEFAKYLSRPLLTYRRTKVDLRVEEDRLASRPLSPAAATLAAAAFHLSMDRTREAATEIQSARAAEPRLAQTEDLDGIRFEHLRSLDNARLAYEKAVSLGSTSYYTYFRLASLLAPSAASPDTLARADTLLERAIALNDRFAPAYQALSRIKTLDGDAGGGIALAQRAAALEPAASQPRLLLAQALGGQSRFVEALTEARRAKTLAADEDERLAVEDLLHTLAASAAASLPPLPVAGPPPAGAIHVGGSLKTRVDGVAVPVIMTVTMNVALQ